MDNEKYKPVSTLVAERIAKEYDKYQVIIICCDAKHDKLHFTTYGETATEKLDAARASNLIKKYHFRLDMPDGEAAPIGFEDFEWSNNVNDFVEKNNE